MKKSIAFVVNDLGFLISHRLKICIQAKASGFDVHIFCPNSKLLEEVLSLGFNVHIVEFGRNKNNPFLELKSILRLISLFKKIQPDIAHLITIKPYLYGGIAARIAGVQSVVSAVAGLGIVFSSNDFKYRAIRLFLYPLYKFAFGHKNQAVIFQNNNDRDSLVKWGVVTMDKVNMIRGSGVDLNSCYFIEEPQGVAVVSLAARLLKDKGVEVFVEASKLLRNRELEVRFWLIGQPDEGNSNSVTQNQLDFWQSEGLVELYGFRNDIPNLFAKSNIVVLPSFYGEGLPKVLIEAAACGRAVVTTDYPGCRDAIEPGKTGVLIPAKAPSSLADALEYLIKNPDIRSTMGRNGRRLAEKEFDVNRVVQKHLQIYLGLLGGS